MSKKQTGLAEISSRIARAQRIKRILASIGIVAALASLGYVIGSWHFREVKQAKESSMYRAVDLNLKFLTLKALAAGKALD